MPSLPRVVAYHGGGIERRFQEARSHGTGVFLHSFSLHRGSVALDATTQVLVGILPKVARSEPQVLEADRPMDYLRTVTLAAALLGMLRGSGVSQETDATDSTGDAAFLFAYCPKAGERELFEEGYRRHLDWHRQRSDPLPWYAWWVVTGDRVGLFVDGTFGISFSAFDARIDPKADAADFAQTTAPFADPTFRRVLRLRRDLSSAAELEARRPSRLVHVIEHRLRAGGEAQFEKVLRVVREAYAGRVQPPAYAWYELIDGGERPSYLLWLPAESWSDLASSAVGLRDLIAGARLGDAEELQRSLADVVTRTVSETWSWAQNLTYLPGAEAR